MSLINDALKKAQRDRSGGVPASVPTPGGGTRPPIESSRGSGSGGPNWILVGGGALAGIVLAGGAFWLLRPGTAPDSSARATTPPTVAVAKPEPAPSTPAAPAARTSSPAPVALTLPTTASTGNSSAPIDHPTTPTATPPPTVAVAPASTSAQQVAPATVAIAKPEPVSSALQLPEITVTSPSTPTAKSSKRLAEIVDALRVSGIRASNRDTKVLMNERVYRLGDIVDHDLGIKLTGATPNSLTFTDANGSTYTRSF